MVNSVHCGDNIVTAGGLRAKVVKVVNEYDVEAEISQNVNVVVIKTTITNVIKN